MNLKKKTNTIVDKNFQSHLNTRKTTTSSKTRNLQKPLKYVTT